MAGPPVNQGLPPLTLEAIAEVVRASARASNVDRVRALINEQASREQEALRLYEPTPYQERYHASTRKVCAIIGGNQIGKALKNGTPVLTPSGLVPIESLQVGDVVYGSDGRPCNVLGVHPQGEVETYRITFDDGTEVVCCEDHLWRCKQGKPRFRGGDWVVKRTQDIVEFGGLSPTPTRRAVIPIAAPVEMPESPVSVDPYAMGMLLGDGTLSGVSIGFTTADQETVDEMRAAFAGKAVVTSHSAKYGYGVRGTLHGRNEVLSAIREYGLLGLRSWELFIPRSYLLNSIEVRLAVLQGLMDSDGSVSSSGGHIEYSTTSPQLAEDVMFLVRSLGGTAKSVWRDSHYVKNGVRHACRRSCRVHVRWTSSLPLFRLPRKLSAIKRPDRIQAGRVMRRFVREGRLPCTCISVDSPDNTFICGDFTVTHNSLSAFAEIARAVTGQDPHNKYPKQNGQALCVGYKEDHIGLVVYRYLFQPGAFKLIRDKATGKLRSWRPWVEDDVARKSERVDAPPLIPSRFIKKFVWEKAGQRVFSSVEFTTGWKLLARSSLGEPLQGVRLDLAHIDEDIERQEWYSETVARLLMGEDSKMRWSALPHSRNDALVNLIEQADGGDPNVEVVQATIFDNPYMPAESRDAVISIWRQEGEEVYRKRALGELTTNSSKVYPSFSRHLHDAMAESPNMSAARRAFIENNGEPPPEWCRVAAIDPGHAVCAVVFIAIPPPSMGIERFVYDELYITQSDAKQFAAGMFKKCDGKSLQRWLIDAHGAAHSSASNGVSVRQAYTEALIERGVKSLETGFHFINGVDHPESREERLRLWLALRNDTRQPTILFNFDRCPNLLREIQRFKKIVDHRKGIVTDKANRRMPCHAVECLEYLAADNPAYVRPPEKRQMTRVQAILDGIKARQAHRDAANWGKAPQFINLGLE